MSKLKELGKLLNKNEQRKILGGRILAQSGWRLDGSNCYCDYSYEYPDGTWIDYCNIPCATLCCSPSMPSPLYQPID